MEWNIGCIDEFLYSGYGRVYSFKDHKSHTQTEFASQVDSQTL